MVNFYRVAWRLDWMDPVYRASPDNTFGYYLLMNDDRSLVERRGLKVMMQDSLSRVTLARGAGW